MLASQTDETVRRQNGVSKGAPVYSVMEIHNLRELQKKQAEEEVELVSSLAVFLVAAWLWLYRRIIGICSAFEDEENEEGEDAYVDG